MPTMPVPTILPVMTLPHTVFFPQALLPLHIFEPRYREMLRDVLAGDRIFAVSRVDPERAGQPGSFEPLERIISAGIVRACQEGADGTADLLLQGLCRLEVTEIVREEPYRLIRVRTLASRPGGNPTQLEIERLQVLRLLAVRRRQGVPTPKGLEQFLESIEDCDTFVDVAIQHGCPDDSLQQKFLEELDTRRRLQRLVMRLKAEVEEQRLRRRLQGDLPDERIARN